MHNTNGVRFELHLPHSQQYQCLLNLFYQSKLYNIKGVRLKQNDPAVFMQLLPIELALLEENSCVVSNRVWKM